MFSLFEGVFKFMILYVIWSVSVVRILLSQNFVSKLEVESKFSVYFLFLVFKKICFQISV